jgi:riboflavin kinase/FMN adenylyltransferase
MLQHLRSILEANFCNSWLTIGTYDGVHIGHQEIIRRMSNEAHRAGALAIVVTFYPHPAKVLSRPNPPLFLTLPEERASFLMDHGIDVVITHPFDHQLAAMSAQDFIELLKKHLDFNHLWVGYDFALGRNREGNVDRLATMQNSVGFQLQVVQPIRLHGEPVSSSRIRSLLSHGKVEQAAQLLGRNYSLSGEVVKGDERGRVIGIPTANLAISTEKLVPHTGVYACLASLDSQLYAAAVNIGVRPTFDTGSSGIHIEAHLLDFAGKIYGKTLNLQFISYLRGEHRFPDVTALIDQINRDIDQTREVLKPVLNAIS